MNQTEHDIMETLQCNVDRVTYRSDDTGWSVLRVSVPGGTDTTIVGTMPKVAEGCALTCHGDWTMNPRFGRQFVVKSFKEASPVTTDGMVKYLSSGLIKGVGPAKAKLIVDRFGLDTFKVIERSPERLAEVPSIGEKGIEKIRESWDRNRDIKNVMTFLQSHGVSVSLAYKIYAKYKKKAIKKVTENPYILADDIWGVGFKKADDIARSLGYSTNDPRRCRAGVMYALQENGKEGHVFATVTGLTRMSAELLECDPSHVTRAMTSLIKDGQLVLEDEAVYLPVLYHCERGVARRLLSLYNGGEVEGFDPDIEAISKATKVEYDDIQIQAIETAARSKVMVLTGGPGTGKTTVTRGIIEAFRSSGRKVLLAAPTGRAAKRMNEATGMEAKTIHRLLEFSPQGGFARDENNPLKGDVLIVDECSMIDIALMCSLVKALPGSMALVLVGDIDQLPSVGVGNVLRDIIDSEVFPVVRLTRIFRQAQESLIVMNAHAINRGDMPRIDNSAGSDFFFLECEDRDELPGRIVELVRDRLPKGYEARHSDIQVLTPMRKGAAGTEALNRSLQAVINPEGESLVFRGVTYRAGDRVMQIRNNYDKDVFNGDLGYVREVIPDDGVVVVSYDGREARYDFSDLDELVLAYACTIHKSQGSEYPIVVMPVHTTHFIMLQRNLVYTGITRAKRVCVLVGSRKALAMAVSHQPSLKRNTRLRQRLADSR